MEISLFKGRTHMGRRLFLLVIGTFILSFGIAMSKKAEIGTSPISCIPATLTYCTDLSIGTWTIIFNILLVAAQVVIMKREFEPIQVLQLAMAVLLGSLTDVSMEILGFMSPGSYIEQWIYCIAACVILSFGVFLEIRANLLVVPGDGLVFILSKKIKGCPFHKIKRYVDATMAITAVVISLVTCGELNGAREGTIFAAIAVGTCIGFYRAKFGGALNRFLESED